MGYITLYSTCVCNLGSLTCSPWELQQAARLYLLFWHLISTWNAFWDWRGVCKLNTFSKYENTKIHYWYWFSFGFPCHFFFQLAAVQGNFRQGICIFHSTSSPSCSCSSSCSCSCHFACGSCNMYVIKSLKSFFVANTKNLLIYELSVDLKV